MIDLSEAQSLVSNLLDNSAGANAPEAIILEESTIEKDFGWVFFYESKQYMKTRDFRDRLLGNAPYIVNKNTGEIAETGTARDVQYYIEEYEKKLAAETGD